MIEVTVYDRGFAGLHEPNIFKMMVSPNSILQIIPMELKKYNEELPGNSIFEKQEVISVGSQIKLEDGNYHIVYETYEELKKMISPKTRLSDAGEE